MAIKTVIIDDEPLARQRIARLLKETDDVLLIAECRNARQAVEVITNRKPDLIFLDIEMHGNDGFSVLQEIAPEHVPVIIIVSAYDQYAMKAFEVEALDYIQKPFDEKRFSLAIEKAKNQIRLKMASLIQDKIKNLVSSQSPMTNEYVNSFSIKENGRTKFISIYDLFYIEAYGNYVKLYFEDGNKTYRSTMKEAESKLDPDLFTRIHRSYIINVQKIKNVRYLNNNEYQFTFQNNDKVTSSRSFKEKIVEVLDLF